MNQNQLLIVILVIAVIAVAAIAFFVGGRVANVVLAAQLVGDLVKGFAHLVGAIY